MWFLSSSNSSKRALELPLFDSIFEEKYCIVEDDERLSRRYDSLNRSLTDVVCVWNSNVVETALSIFPPIISSFLRPGEDLLIHPFVWPSLPLSRESWSSNRRTRLSLITHASYARSPVMIIRSWKYRCYYFPWFITCVIVTTCVFIHFRDWGISRGTLCTIWIVSNWIYLESRCSQSSPIL